MNSRAVCPKSRCSSVRSSRTNTSSDRRGELRNCPPSTGACVCVIGSLVARQPGVLTSIAAEKYKPDNVPTINELFQLKDRVAIVTGGSRGIGQEMAEGLAEAGASLMLCARRDEWLTPTVAAMRARGFTVEGTRCDVAKAADVQAVVDKTIAVFGRIDILVNNA